LPFSNSSQRTTRDRSQFENLTSLFFLWYATKKLMLAPSTLTSKFITHTPKKKKKTKKMDSLTGVHHLKAACWQLLILCLTPHEGSASFTTGKQT
jgi:hypothetical protein